MEVRFIATSTFKLLDEILFGGYDMTTENLQTVFESIINKYYFTIKLHDMERLGLIRYRGKRWEVTKIGRQVYQYEFDELIRPIVERHGVEVKNKVV